MVLLPTLLEASYFDLQEDDLLKHKITNPLYQLHADYIYQLLSALHSQSPDPISHPAQARML